jgi:hypothetical protein
VSTVVVVSCLTEKDQLIDVPDGLLMIHAQDATVLLCMACQSGGLPSVLFEWHHTLDGTPHSLDKAGVVAATVVRAVAVVALVAVVAVLAPVVVAVIGAAAVEFAAAVVVPVVVTAVIRAAAVAGRGRWWWYPC